MLLDLEKLVKEHEIYINGVFHIGAHYGTENEVYNRLEIQNRIFFEPLPKNFEVLEKNVIGHKLENIALGNMNGIIGMHVEDNNQGQSSSILEPDLHLKQYPKIKFEKVETVQIKKLDDYIKENYIDMDLYNFINIDVQGYELEVFKGGAETLKYINYVMAEVNRDSLYKGCPMVEELDEYLNNYGFVRKETSWAGGTWGDAFYIKEIKHA